MLKLFILRHAQAASDYNVDDYQRPLTLHGIEQAGLVASSLPNIETAICSSALRTKMTLEAVKKAGTNIKKTLYSDAIYNAPAGELLTAIQGAGTAKTLLIIAHNPGIHQLANILSAEDSSTLREELRFSYAPATLSILECPIDNWADIKPQKNTLVDLVVFE